MKDHNLKMSHPAQWIIKDHNLPPLCFTVGAVFGCWLVLSFCQTYSLALRPKSSVLVSSDYSTFFHLASKSSRCILVKLKQDLNCPFLRSVFFFSCEPPIQARLVKHMHTMTALCHEIRLLLQSCHWTLSSLSDQIPSPVWRDSLTRAES